VPNQSSVNTFLKLRKHGTVVTNLSWGCHGSGGLLPASHRGGLAGFTHSTVHASFMVDKVTPAQIFSEILGFLCQYNSAMSLHTMYHLGDEQSASSWLQFKDIFSSHRHEQQQQGARTCCVQNGNVKSCLKSVRKEILNLQPGANTSYSTSKRN
jgi:hypothetical protein